jgi:hypothetical protein
VVVSTKGNNKLRKKIGVAVIVAALALTGCSSTRRIDPSQTGSFKIEGTSWYGFCQGRNAFIWVPSRTDSDPDELEAVVYDDYRCVAKVEAAQPQQPSSSPSPTSSKSKPDADPDGIIDDND